MPANKKVKTAKNTKNMEPSLPEDLKDKITRWKEMFPQYRQSTNDDIIAIFEDYNNDFSAAVYGAMNGLITTKPAGGWQSVGQKKKKKSNAQRPQTTNQKNYRAAPSQSDTSNRGRKGANRGQSSGRGSSNRQKDNTRPPRNTNAQPAKTSKPNSNSSAVSTSSWANETDSQPWTSEANTSNWASESTTAWTSESNTSDWTSEPTPAWSNEPETDWATEATDTKAKQNLASSNAPNSQVPKQTIHKQSQPPVQNSTPTQSSGERLSYANVARSRQAWNPNKPATQLAKKENVQLMNEPITQAAETKTQQQAPQSSVPSSAPVSVAPQTFPQQSTPSTSAPPAETNNTQSNATPAASAVSKPVEKPRVGVLLPTSNFEGVAFQFGNLGLSDEDLVASSRPSDPKEQLPNASQPISSVNSSQHTSNKPEPSSKPESNIPGGNQEEQNMPAAPMYPPQYPVYPGMDSGEPLRVQPMAFFPGDTYQPHVSGYIRPEGKYRPNQSGNQSGGRGEATNTKFSSDSAQTVPSQPFPYAYPMYPYQFHGGSYGNQFYSYGFNPKFPYSQNFGNTVPYAPDEESSKHRMSAGHYPPAQDGSNVSNSKQGDQSTSGSKQTNSKAGNSNAQSSGTSGGSNAQSSSGAPSMEGNFSQEFNKNLQGGADLYGMEYNSSFMNPPFFHHQYQPQPQQPGSRYN